MRNRVLMIAAAAEVLTGFILLWSPSIIVPLLFGDEIAGAGIIISRVAGIALIAFGIACWPGRDRTQNHRQAFAGMLVYSALSAVYLGYLALSIKPVGKLLWPAVFFHLVVTLLLAFRGKAAR